MVFKESPEESGAFEKTSAKAGGCAMAGGRAMVGGVCNGWGCVQWLGSCAMAGEPYNLI